MAYTKKALRQHIKSQWQSMSPAGILAQSQVVCDKALSLLRGENIMLFASLKYEVQIDTLLNAAIKRHGFCILPRVSGDELLLFKVRDLDLDLATGAFGVREPSLNLEAFSATAISTVVVPGEAFDRYGNRLGKGKGFYDRLLAQTPQAYTLGICLPFQLVDEVPTEAHDQCLDGVVSADGVVK